MLFKGKENRLKLEAKIILIELLPRLGVPPQATHVKRDRIPLALLVEGLLHGCGDGVSRVLHALPDAPPGGGEESAAQGCG